MNILMATTEMEPFAQTGTWATDMRDLVVALCEAGHEVTVILPFYRCVREAKSIKAKKSKTKFLIPMGSSNLPCEIFEAAGPGGSKILLIARDEFFDRTGLYGTEGRDYQDNSARFIFFSKCIVEIARRTNPDILHVHGWQTALAPVFVRNEGLSVTTVLTPEGLEYQGNFWSYDFALTNLPDDYFSARGVEYYGSMNCLKAGILFADSVILPSRRFLYEMQTSVYGCGLENVLREQSFKLEGITPGLPAAAWPVLPSSPVAKSAAREKLLSSTSLHPDGRVFLVDTTATRGGGLDALFAALDRLPSDDIRILLLGGIPDVEMKAYHIAKRRHVGRFHHIEKVDERLLQAALAGSDFLILPGPVEPGGEFLLLSMRNGVIPIAVRCGGLRQFVKDHDPVTGIGNGFVFSNSTTDALVDAMHRAARCDPQTLLSIEAAARETDITWSATARHHTELYTRILRRVGRPG